MNGADGKDGNNGATGKKGAQGVAGVAGANGKNGSNGLNGRNGANGVTTIITKHEVDQTTKNNVASNRNAISSNRSAINAMNQQTNSQFKSLKSEVDDNRKQANAGISGAMAMAGLPQVQTNQRVMFAAGGATYNGESAVAVGASVNFNDHVVGKVSFSDDTSNNMGASVGVGIGF
ncbi:TPA: YadA-like family protein [Enterobacter cloacae]|nr:YadA-like family protein [Enterobacter cloacae]